MTSGVWHSNDVTLEPAHSLPLGLLQTIEFGNGSMKVATQTFTSLLVSPSCFKVYGLEFRASPNSIKPLSPTPVNASESETRPTPHTSSALDGGGDVGPLQWLFDLE